MDNELEKLCNCEYRDNCHLPRQYVQDLIRKRTGTTEKECEFYKMILEKIFNAQK